MLNTPIMPLRLSITTLWTVMIAALGLNGCAWLAPAGISGAVAWRDLPAWDQDRHAESWPALLRSCERLARQDRSWTQVCGAAHGLSGPNDTQAREFFEKWFTPHKVRGTGWRTRGLITGYYEPLLRGRLTPSNQFRYPIYARPKDLLIVDLSEMFPELKDKRVRGKLIGNRVVPYHDRQQIDTQQELLAGQELLWVDDPVALFFLHIQGSGRVELPDGRIIAVGYADQNGHPYRSIGRELIEMGELASEDVNMFSIRDWLRGFSERAAYRPAQSGSGSQRDSSRRSDLARYHPAGYELGTLPAPGAGPRHRRCHQGAGARRSVLGPWRHRGAHGGSHETARAFIRTAA
jgi:membrane-bound lytic murein transglycosylase A